MSWQSFQAPTAAIDPALQLATSLSTIGEPVANVFKLTAEAIKLIDALKGAEQDPIAVAARAALAGIQSALDSLLTAHAGLHFLPIPLIKTGLKPTAPIIPGDTSRNKAFDAITASTANLLGSGGNFGFYNTIYNSLQDANDSSRPQYGSNDAVAGMVVLVGSSSLGEALVGVNSLSKLLGDIGAHLDANITPVPQNLKAKVIPSIPGVELTWEPIPSPSNAPGFAARFVTKNILIYRSETPIRATMPQAEIDSKLIKTLPYGLLTVSYVDQTAQPGHTYYYAMAVRSELIESSGTVTPSTASVLSNSVVVRMTDSDDVPSGTFSRGTPPDWVSFSRPLQMFEPVYNLLKKVRVFVDSFANSLGAADTALQRLADNLQQMAINVNGIVAALNEQVNRINDALSFASAGLYVMTFAGLGGNNYFLNQLGHGLTNTNDPTAPPFTQGTEPTAGFVFLVGASGLDGLSDIINFINLVSNGGGASTDASGNLTQIGISQTLQQLKAACDELSTTLNPVFSDNMQQVAAGDPFPSPKPDPIC